MPRFHYNDTNLWYWPIWLNEHASHAEDIERYFGDLDLETSTLQTFCARPELANRTPWPHTGRLFSGGRVPRSRSQYCFVCSSGLKRDSLSGNRTRTQSANAHPSAASFSNMDMPRNVRVNYSPYIHQETRHGFYELFSICDRCNIDMRDCECYKSQRTILDRPLHRYPYGGNRLFKCTSSFKNIKLLDNCYKIKTHKTQTFEWQSPTLKSYCVHLVATMPTRKPDTINLLYRKRKRKDQ